MYWKTTKNAADGCSAHIFGGLFAGGNVGLPDQAAFLIEATRFEGDTALEAWSKGRLCGAVARHQSLMRLHLEA